MSCYEEILLCYDSTREGRRALIKGAELAQALGAKTHLLAIAAASGGYFPEAPSEIALSEEERGIREILKEGVERLRARGLTATGHLVFGDPIEQIPAVAKSLGCDLIVVGYRPCGIVQRWWAGAGNAQLLDRVSCSVLVSIAAD